MSNRKLQALELEAQLAHVRGFLDACATYVINPELNMHWTFLFISFDARNFPYITKMPHLKNWRAETKGFIEAQLLAGIQYSEEYGQAISERHLKIQRERVVDRFYETIGNFMDLRGDSWRCHPTNSFAAFVFEKDEAKTPAEQYILLFTIE